MITSAAPGIARLGLNRSITLRRKHYHRMAGQSTSERRVFFFPYFAFVAIIAFGIYASAVGVFFTKSINLVMDVMNRVGETQTTEEDYT